MSRQARQKSKTGIYHIMLRGINRQDIFQDDEDKGVYLERLSNYKNECRFKIYAYCLMNNHVHLLLKEGSVSISDVMKRIGASYVYWYNRKYDRIGHLFQDRYKSEPIECEKYLITVLRYIHQNPIKVGLPIDSWTSYNDYLGDDGITDKKSILELFGRESEIARNEFIKYMSQTNNDLCLDISERKRITDDEAKEIIKKIGKITTCQELQQIDRDTRGMILKKLKEEGLSIRQIERLSGLNRGVILKA